jgi:phosphatidylglycerophosphatase A
MRQKIVEALATGFYLGKIPVMPGTFGTLLGIPVVWLFGRWVSGPVESSTTYMFSTVVLLLISIAVAELYELQTQNHDPKEVVIDEVVGFAITMTWLPHTWQAFVAGFVMFRFFDILKPFPISYIDRKVRGGLGTVLDDVAAGVVANILMQVIYTQTDWLGARLVHGI